MMHKEEFEKAKLCLDKSQVISFPTETVMGLGVYFDDFKAYQELNNIKRREPDKPYTLMLGDKRQIEKYAYVDDRAKRIIDKFMPGAITLLLKVKENVPSYVTHGTSIIGVRVPALKELCDFINYLNKPLLVPSANRSGEKPAMSSKEVKAIFKNEISYVFDGESNSGVPSTIVDLTNKEVKIVREGNISLDDILSTLEKE